MAHLKEGQGVMTRGEGRQHHGSPLPRCLDVAAANPLKAACMRCSPQAKRLLSTPRAGSCYVIVDFCRLELSANLGLLAHKQACRHRNSVDDKLQHMQWYVCAQTAVMRLSPTLHRIAPTCCTRPCLSTTAAQLVPNEERLATAIS